MNKTFAGDYKFGTESEDATITSLRILDSTLSKMEKYSPFDYEGHTCYVELKTRRNKKDTYPTTMIPQSKIEYAKKDPSKTYHFAFKFEDGLYYIQYNQERFAQYEVKQGGRFDRGRPELNQYCYIPVTDLIELK